MSSKVAAEFFSKGKEALEHEHTYLARVCFENAVNEERNPAHCSYLALALAKSRGEYDRAINLAEEAIAADPQNSIHYLNLGRIFIAANRKPEALEILRAGVQVERDPEILRQLNELGNRGRPVLAWLSRDHPLNKYLGILLTRLGLRRART